MWVVDMLVVRIQNAWFGVRDEESGQTLVEYALIIAIIAIGAIAALTFLRGTIADLFERTGSSLASTPG